MFRRKRGGFRVTRTKSRGIRFGILSPKLVWRPKIIRTFYTTTFELKEGVKFLFGEKATFAP